MVLKKVKVPFMDYAFLSLGAAVMALGISVFLVDAKVVPGGVSGLSMSIYYLSGYTIPVGLLMWVLNVPLFLWGLKELGRSFAFRTFYSFTLNSFFIDFFRGDVWLFPHIRLQDLPAVRDLFQHDFFFLILIGATLLGVGLGIVFKFKGTTAGSDIVAAVLHKRFGIKPGQAIMMTDFFVISFAGLVIAMKGLSPDKPALSLTLYAFFLLFVSSKIVDIILDGFDYARMAYIISDKHEEISQAIMNDMSRGATALKSRGLYRNVDREVIMTIITMKEISKLNDLCKEIDDDAFIIISNVHEVFGKGFRRRF